LTEGKGYGKRATEGKKKGRSLVEQVERVTLQLTLSTAKIRKGRSWAKTQFTAVLGKQKKPQRKGMSVTRKAGGFKLEREEGKKGYSKGKIARTNREIGRIRWLKKREASGMIRVPS